jgi:quercetin dioxygenase-like cupin family protein
MLCPTTTIPAKLISAIAVGAIVTFTPFSAVAQSQGKFVVSKMAEKSVAALPAGELYWHVESFASIDDANAASGDYSLAAEFDDKAWLFTLAEKTAAGMGGVPVASIGPVPRIDAPDILLRVNNATAPKGSKTSIHSHPGAEAILVLTGQVTQHTPYGMHVLNSGGTLPGVPDQTMQMESTGDEDLRQLIMFVVDANRPFSEKKEHLD